MPEPNTPTRASIWRPWLVMPSAVLGAAGGIFLYGYWLTGLLSVGDEQTAALTAGVGVLAAIGSYFLLSWTVPRLQQLPIRSRWLGILISLPVSAFMLLGGTSNWILPNRYLDFLLPDHRLQLSALPPQAAPGTALVWFNTALGDVSYGTIQYDGWKRVGDELVVRDGTSNSLTWTGEVGHDVQLVFSGEAPGVEILISWDGHPETVLLSKGKTAYSRSFEVPLYASRTAVIVLGVLCFYILTLALFVLVWTNRSRLENAILSSLGRISPRLSGVDLWLIVAAMSVAALLRIFNLGGVFPAVDEYYHLIAAKQILAGAPLSSVYSRGLWIVTLPVALAFRVFGYQLWAARLVGALFNIFAVIPLYLLARGINRPVAAMASFLFATSPWIIAFARVAREYAYYPFYFFWIIYALIAFIGSIPQGFVLLRQWRSLIRPKTIVLAGFLIFPPIFGLKIDWLSTFRTILIAYLVSGLFVLSRFDWRDRANWPILAVVGVLLILTGRSWYLEQSSKLLVLPQLNTVPIEYFLPNPQQQWYLDRMGIVVALGIVTAILSAFLVRRRNFVPLFILTLFFAYLSVFALFSKTFFHTRHLLSTELWYVIVVAMGLYATWIGFGALLPHLGRTVPMVMAAIVVLSVVNLSQVMLPTVSTNADMTISEDYMHDMSKVQAFMLAQVRPDDVLISTVYGQYAIWEGTPVFANQLHITSHTPIEDILSYASQYDSGWIVIDEIRFKLASMSIRDLAGSDQIQYVGMYGDEHVWHWQRTPAHMGRMAAVGGSR